MTLTQAPPPRKHFTVVTPRRIAYGVAWIMLFVGGITVPMPFFSISPGNAIEVQDLIVVDDREVEPLDGSSALLAVVLRRPSVAELLLARVDDATDIVPLARYLPSGQEDEDYFKDQSALFGDTFTIAAAIALDAAGEEVDFRSSPVIAGVLPFGPSDGHLLAGDLVLEINGVAVQTADELVIQARHLGDGDPVHLLIERGGKTLDVEYAAGKVQRMDRPGLGVTVDTAARDVVLPVDVHLAEGVRIGGPSAGLMFTVTVYDLISAENLLSGRRVAGTGTINLDGTVGNIGSIRQKVAAAIRDGYAIFLAPAGQEAEAREAAGNQIQVIGVATFNEALNAIREAPLTS